KKIFGPPKKIFGALKKIFGPPKMIFGALKKIFGDRKMIFGDRYSCGRGIYIAGGGVSAGFRL
ncbi:MAG: hypothetical protein LBK77_08985, partial [Spirochaetaceae bacterium]|nr:hypothetical protein [Spirochaetaceae bacterium]